MEIWKTIKDYENYEASNFGRVRSKKTNCIMKQMVHNTNHIVSLRDESGSHQRSVAVLVGNTFLDKPQNTNLIRHKDGNKSNNNSDNLEWIYSTRKEKELKTKEKLADEKNNIVIIDDEIWKKIKDYEHYEISNYGRLRNANTKKFCVLSHKEYGIVKMFEVNRKKNSVFVHRLVAEAFIPNPNNHNYVVHKDGNIKNNNSDNLEWKSYGELQKQRKINKNKNKVIIHNENEIWKSIEGFDKYEISTHGRVKNKEYNDLLKFKIRDDGYNEIGLYNSNNTQMILKVHILVAKAFLNNHEKYPIVNHKDGNKRNNNVNNLEWCTYSQNTIHAHENELIIAHGHKTKINQIDPITNEIVKLWDSMTDICKYLNISNYKLTNLIAREMPYDNYLWKKYEEDFYIDEEWRNIGGYDGYKISNYGRVMNALGFILKTHYSTYEMIKLIKKGVSKNFCVHRLVAKEFIPNTHNKPFVNHIDANKHNNHINNLEWCTQKENIDHAVKIGNVKTKAICQYDLDGNLINIFNSCNEACRKLNFKRISIYYALIGKIKNVYGYKWKYLYDCRSYM